MAGSRSMGQTSRRRRTGRRCHRDRRDREHPRARASACSNRQRRSPRGSAGALTARFVSTSLASPVPAPSQSVTDTLQIAAGSSSAV